MTGYGVASCDTPVTLIVELRGVNGRYLDLSLRIPDDLRAFESAFRERLRAAIVRGKVECRVSLERDAPMLRDAPDPQVLARLARTLQSLREALPDLQPPSATALLNMPGLFGDPVDPDALRGPLLATLEQALDQFTASRIAEGGRLAEFVEARLKAIEAIADTLAGQAPRLLEHYQARLVARLEQALGAAEGAERLPLDEVMARVRQEVAAYGMRTDATEELDRLRSHVSEFRARLAGSGPIGKRLDFLTQELNREANTLASKAAALDISHAAVELKVLIEQIREQIQNLE